VYPEDKPETSGGEITMAMLQTRRERFLMGLTAIAILFGGGYLVAFRPLMVKYQGIDQQISEVKKSWENTKEQFIKSKQYRAEFDRIRESLSIEGTAQDKKTKITEELTSLLEQASITPNSQTENAAERIDDDFQIYTFSLKNISTDWPTLSAFLYMIETNPAVLEVKTLTVRRRTGAGVTSNAAISADVDVSRLVENKITRTREGRRKR
jgi:Tfp pilus assembly protein PilO